MAKPLTAEQIATLEQRHREERERIRSAADELIATSEGRPRIEDLRVKAVVGERWRLTTRHTDLKDDFLRRVEAKWGRESPAQVALQRRFDDLYARYERLRVRADELEELTETYAVVIEELGRQAASSSDEHTLRSISGRAPESRHRPSSPS